MSILTQIHQAAVSAFASVGCESSSPVVFPASRPEFGDVQINGVMNAAKQLKKNPRELAAQIIAQLNLADKIDNIEIAGPGFINLRLSKSWLAKMMTSALRDERLGIALLPSIKCLVDYSSPNLAKEMHVGHLRSTIIGDALTRILQFMGHEVIRVNHVGDWGTQFGMLVAHFVEQVEQKNLDLVNLEAFYKEAKTRFDSDPTFADRARSFVVRLQSGDAEVLAHWRQFVALSLSHAKAVYDRLGVLLTPADVRGESAYNDDLPQVVSALNDAGVLMESQGAKVVFLPEFKNADGEPLGIIIQKKDGGYLYATSDLATLRYRAHQLGVQRILYVVDARQTLHFEQIFTLSRRVGFVPPSISLEHVAFGMVMGEDGKPFKTRSGESVKLMDLLEEANHRALSLTQMKNPDLPKESLMQIAQAVAIGAVKYADLSKSRQSDYVFSFDGMLAMEGNTAPYLMYAYTRVQSLFRKVDDYNPQSPLEINTQEEQSLVFLLLQFEDVLMHVVESSQPHHLCTYLYQIATKFSRFYESFPILKSEPNLRQSRLQISALTARTLKLGLGLLGINVLETM